MPRTHLPRTILLFALAVLAAPMPTGAEAPLSPVAPPDRVVYSNGFERTVGREWSLPITDTAPRGDRFLGQFGNDSVSLTLAGLPAHIDVTVTFDLYVIRTWDGASGDFWGLTLGDGRTLCRTTFSNMDDFSHRQAWPDAAPGGDHPARAGAHEVNTLGFRDKGSARDAVYRMAFSFEHIGADLELKFAGAGLQDLADESWGLDHVRVIVRNDPGSTPTEGRGFLSFDGTDDCITIPNHASLDLKGSLTLEAQVRIPDDRDGQIIWRGDTRADHDPYELHVHKGRMEFRLDPYFKGRYRQAAVRSPMPPGSGWHLWSGVYDRDAGMIYLYRDGVLQAREEVVGEIDYDTKKMWNMIGAVDRGSWQHLKGYIKEVRIWNVARSRAEIKGDLDRPLAGEERGLVACWRSGLQLGQVVRDISPNRNHGVLGTSLKPEKSDPSWMDLR